MLLFLCSFTLCTLRHVPYVMKKKTIIIIASVAAVFVLGLLSSIYFNWPVDRNDSDADIAKSSHFLRKYTEERIDNMKELLQTDEAFRNNLLAANLVMHTRAAQFSALVDMSNEVAGGIPEYADVLKDMNAARPMIDNVRTILGDLLNALDGDLSGGEESERFDTRDYQRFAGICQVPEAEFPGRPLHCHDRRLSEQETHRIHHETSLRGPRTEAGGTLF